MRKRFAIAVLLLLALAGTVVYLARPEPFVPGITWANAARIESGMTEAEVVAIVGRIPNKLRHSYRGMIYEDEPPDAALVLFWSGNECDIHVYLDCNGRTLDVRANGPPAPTWFDRLSRRLGL